MRGPERSGPQEPAERRPNRPPTAGGESHVGHRTKVRKQQGVLQQQPDAAGVGRHVDTGRRVGEHPIAHPDVPGIQADQCGDGMQGGRLACAVGAQYRQHLPCRNTEFHVQSAIFEDRAHLQRRLRGHVQPPARSRRLPNPMTTTAATATNSTASATGGVGVALAQCR